VSIHLPGLRHVRRAPRHKAADEVTHLRHQLAGAGIFITDLRRQLADARAAEDTANAKAVRVDEAEARADKAEQLAREMGAELITLKAFKANVNAVTLPMPVRDVDPDDQPTHPIYVRHPQDSLNAGPVTPVTDPGQTTWGAMRERGAA